MYKPPKEAQENAQWALNAKNKYNLKAGTRTGWIRARQLASGKKVSKNIVKRMYLFKRHMKNARINPKYINEPYKDKGYLMWMAWGGTEGILWAEKTYKKIK